MPYNPRPEEMGVDPDKWPTSVAHEIYHRGVKLVSRYRKEHEFDLLTRIADAIMDNCPAVGVTEIFCDSKATSVFSIDCQFAPLSVASIANAVCMRRNGGHNGICVRTPEAEIWVDPDWDE